MSDTPTIFDSNVTPSSDTHDDGWLTAESYIAWVSSQAGVLLQERPFSQPPPLVETDVEDESALETIAA